MYNYCYISLSLIIIIFKLANLKEVANNNEQIDRVNFDDLQDTMKVECMWVQKLSKADGHILLSGE